MIFPRRRSKKRFGSFHKNLVDFCPLLSLHPQRRARGVEAPPSKCAVVDRPGRSPSRSDSSPWCVVHWLLISFACRRIAQRCREPRAAAVAREPLAAVLLGGSAFAECRKGCTPPLCTCWWEGPKVVLRLLLPCRRIDTLGAAHLLPYYIHTHIFASRLLSLSLSSHCSKRLPR